MAMRDIDPHPERNLSGEPDEALYDHFRRTGDRESFGVLFDRYADRLTLFIYSIVRQKEDAEELTLDTFAVVAAQKSVYRGESGFGTWLFAIAQKQAYQALRKRRPLSLILRDSIPSGDDPPETALLKDERNRQLYRALEQLKPEYRQTLYLMSPIPLQRARSAHGRSCLPKSWRRTGFA